MHLKISCGTELRQLANGVGPTRSFCLVTTPSETQGMPWGNVHWRHGETPGLARALRAMSPKFVPFELERWQSTWENRVRFNLSESGVHPLTIQELLGLG